MRRTTPALLLGVLLIACGGPTNDSRATDVPNVASTDDSSALFGFRGSIPTPPAQAGPTDSVALSFWYGDKLGSSPFPLGMVFHQAVTTPVIPISATEKVSFIEALTLSLAGFTNRQASDPAGGVTIPCQPGKCAEGYTLLSSLSGYTNPKGEHMFSILVDKDGNVVREWPLFGFPAKMLPGGYVIAAGPCVGDSTRCPDMSGHQEQGSLVQMDWCGNPVWSWDGIPGRPGGARQHHDFQREGSPTGYFAPLLAPKPFGGKTLVLAHDNPPISETPFSNYPLEDDSIYEVDEAGNVLWEWHAFQHFEQMGFDDVAQQAIKTTLVGAPAGLGGGAPESDWQHLNNANYLGPNRFFARGDLRFHPDNVLWDGRSSNIIAIVARHDHPQGKWKSGDIVWKVGPNYGVGNDEFRLGQIIGQHHAHMIPATLPGGGHILVFDNGGLAGFGSLMPGAPAYWPAFYRDYSRVLEFDPQTLEVVWEYTLRNPAGGQHKFFSWFISSAQRLWNGNTLIDEGADGRIFEVTPKGEIVWEFFSPFGPSGSGDLSGFGKAVYRAYRVPRQWLPENLDCPARPL